MRIPAELYRIAWDGEAPISSSPWGESAAAVSAPIFRGGEVAVYNPFPIPRGSSEDFAALQVHRALAEAYGTAPPYEEIRDLYLATGADGTVELREGGAPLARDHPELRLRGGLRAFLPVALLVVPPWLAFAALVYRFSRGDQPSLAGRGVLPAVFFAAAGAGAGSIAAHAVGLADLPALSRLAAVLVRHLGDAVAAPLWGAVAAVLLLAVYALAEARFRRLEAPAACAGSPCAET